MAGVTVLGFDVMDSFSLPLCTRYCKQPSGVTTTSAFVPAPLSMLITTCAQIASQQDNSIFPQRQQTTYNATQRIQLGTREGSHDTRGCAFDGFGGTATVLWW